MTTIGLFYGSTTCYTEMAGEKIIEAFTQHIPDVKVDFFDIKDAGLNNTAHYDYLIFGISTWDFGEIQEDWEAQWQDVAELDLDGKLVMLYGLGDQYGYAEWFQDALGMLHDVVVARGAAVVGYWPNTPDYEFEQSKALINDNKTFVGLALDDENQFELTEDRIKRWVLQLKSELQL